MPVKCFYPTLYRRRITDITLQDLQAHGIRGLLLDVDNTLTEHHSQYLSEEIEAWLAAMQAGGIALTVVSNSWEWRVAPFAEKIGLRHISLACKPSPIGFLRAVRRLGLPRCACAAVGDQVFTDIIGANLCGIPCILLEPIRVETGMPTMQLKRRWERRIRARCKEEQP